jgi:hypothetical protein
MSLSNESLLARIKLAMPAGWFGDASPVLDALLTAISQAWMVVVSGLQFIRRQSRIQTATDAWLDLAAVDYVGDSLIRGLGESDALFRGRLRCEMMRERGTRQALQQSLSDLTGIPPVIFEPANTRDAGGYGRGSQDADFSGGGVGYGSAGGWGSLVLPYQVFVTVHRPSLSIRDSSFGWGLSQGAYNGPQIAYHSLGEFQSSFEQEDVNRAIMNVLPVAVTAWVRLAYN